MRIRRAGLLVMGWSAMVWAQQAAPQEGAVEKAAAERVAAESQVAIRQSAEKAAMASAATEQAAVQKLLADKAAAEKALSDKIAALAAAQAKAQAAQEAARKAGEERAAAERIAAEKEQAALLAAQQASMLSEREMAVHVLHRLGFGPSPGQVEQVAQMGWKNWVEQQLNPASIDDKDLESRIASQCPSLRMSMTGIMQVYQPPYTNGGTPAEQDQRNKLRGRLMRELTTSVLLRGALSRRQFNEVMVEFWRNHFAVNQAKDGAEYMAGHYEQNVLRKHAFGRFEDLLLATAHHPEMLIYLDNQVSRKSGLNENYARELMELHTLGVDNVYKQPDVINLARALTGWTCGWQRNDEGENKYVSFFNAGEHDASPVEVVGFKIEGKGGMADGEAAIRHLARHQGTARYLSAKLCRYLVCDKPPQSLVDRTAEAFVKTGGDLPAVYRAIILSPEFASPGHYLVKYKTPFEFVVSSLRATGAQIENPDHTLHMLRLMGQPVYECGAPTGYYDQAEAWLDPGSLVHRWEYARQLASNNCPGVKVPDPYYEALQKMTPEQARLTVIGSMLHNALDAQGVRSMSGAPDVKAMLGLALGSPAFQQQ